MLYAIYSMSSDGYIARENGELPFQSKSDLQNFKRITMGHTVVMGRTTWESLPSSVRPLPGRFNVVLSKDPKYAVVGAIVRNSVAEVLALSTPNNRIFVIGGTATLLAFQEHFTQAHVTVFDEPLKSGLVAPLALTTQPKAKGKLVDRSSGCSHPWRQYNYHY